MARDVVDMVRGHLAFETEADAADNLLGVIVEVEAGRPVDVVSLRTLKRVYEQLAMARMVLSE